MKRSAILDHPLKEEIRGGGARRDVCTFHFVQFAEVVASDTSLDSVPFQAVCGDLLPFIAVQCVELLRSVTLTARPQKIGAYFCSLVVLWLFMRAEILRGAGPTKLDDNLASVAEITT